MKIIYNGITKRGQKYTIRYPSKDDAVLMLDYINNLSKEKTFIRFQGEQVSLEEETKYLEDELEKIHDHKSIILLIESDGVIYGIADINLKDKSSRHEGVFGISLHKEFRGQGIGKILLRLTIDEAVKNIPDLKLITLGVFGNNKLAVDMYKKEGFTEYGRLPRGAIHRDKYVDHIYMYKRVRDF